MYIYSNIIGRDMSNCGYCNFDNYCSGSLDSIIDDININDLADLVESNTEAINSINPNNPNNQFGYCDFFNMLLCYGGQFINLLYLILFLYWWSNQSIYCFLMNQNCQMTGCMNSLLSQCCENSSKK